jgi:hypothetical protein
VSITSTTASLSSLPATASVIAQSSLIGPIVGGVGGVALLVCIVIVIYCAVRCYTKNHRVPAAVAGDSKQSGVRTDAVEPPVQAVKSDGE